jgi:regulation of enolase protein 1 (concanavalin A-like superfamily)
MATAASAEEKILFTEPFADKLADGWTWLREDPQAWRLEKGALVIRTSRGGLWLGENGGGNLPLRTPPELKVGKLAVEVQVEIEPSGGYENAGLIWYYDDDNYIILVKEKIGNGVVVQLVQEADRKVKAGFHKDAAADKSVWFRMEVEGRKLSGYHRASPEDEWHALGQCELPTSGDPKVGLTTAYAPKDVDHFTRFTNFRMLQIPTPAEKSESK